MVIKLCLEYSKLLNWVQYEREIWRLFEISFVVQVMWFTSMYMVWLCDVWHAWVVVWTSQILPNINWHEQWYSGLISLVSFNNIYWLRKSWICLNQTTSWFSFRALYMWKHICNNDRWHMPIKIVLLLRKIYCNH